MRTFACVAAVLLVTSGPAFAQEVDGGGQRPDSADAKKPPTPEHTGVHALFRNLGEDYKNLFHLDNLVVAGLGGGAALAVAPWDAVVNDHLRSHYEVVNDI